MRQKEENNTPALANWLASKFLKKTQHEEFLGDLEEIYRERVSRNGKFYARMKYWLDMFHILIGFSVLNPFKTDSAMYGHYLIIAKRNLWRNKVYSAINIFGLATGMGICLLICQYVYFESGYDKFHRNFENIFRVLIHENRNGTDQGTSPYATYMFGEAAKDEIPEIEDFVRVLKANESAVVSHPRSGRPVNENASNFLFADESFLEVFDFPLKSGAKESALNGMGSIVITQKTSEKYFGSDDPIGSTLEINGGNLPGNYIVTGVLKELPLNSQFQFDFLLPLENFWKNGNGGSVNRYGGWIREMFATYFTISESGDVPLISSKLDELFLKYRGRENADQQVVEKTRLQPIGDVHLKSESYASIDFVSNKGSLKDVRIFSLVAFFVLFIAWVNYINLSTARSMQRAREVGVRKSIGAFRRQLIGQFLVESTLINIVAAFLAIGIAFLALPLLGRIVGKELQLSLLWIPMFWGIFFAIVLIGSFLSGLYPAFILSGFKPISMLGTAKTVQAGNTTLRKGLITFQFLTSLILISGTYLVYKQITYMKNQELGMNIEKVLVLKGPKIIKDSPKVIDGTDMNQIRAFNEFSRSTFRTFRDEVSTDRSISKVAGSYSLPGRVDFIPISDNRKLGLPESAGRYGRLAFASLDFLETFGFELMAGSTFTKEMSEEEYVIINEEAVRSFGFGSARDAVGEKLISGGIPVTVIGVVKDFHWESLREPDAPYIFSFTDSTPPYISFRMDLSDIHASLEHIERVYDLFYPGNPFDYFFLEEDFNRQYQADVRFGNLFLAFTILGILIACIGLFALVSYSATLRMKEIGVRKVLGAGTGNLMMLLSKEYLVLLLWATVLAIPIILYTSKEWLEGYAFRTSIGFDLLLIPASILLVISIVTVSRQTYSAATLNPVKALKMDT
ncbi:ABC transporter permease [Ulvibacterium marinum]|uniref:ABC transporter permease n=1 Tax=Ulvibacterium marinum TaxID=2419782 RepID=A0A3B0C195_9FLAO|nr:ABC transporter permease [Ulvibacterium marinum]RKN77969.1 ABC transporter permease [Ulvibacterium marinum]